MPLRAHAHSWKPLQPLCTKTLNVERFCFNFILLFIFLILFEFPSKITLVQRNWRSQTNSFGFVFYLHFTWYTNTQNCVYSNNHRQWVGKVAQSDWNATLSSYINYCQLREKLDSLHFHNCIWSRLILYFVKQFEVFITVTGGRGMFSLHTELSSSLFRCLV